jgi:hypothetical protein
MGVGDLAPFYNIAYRISRIAYRQSAIRDKKVSSKSLAVRNRAYELHEVGLRRLVLACEGRLCAFCCRDFPATPLARSAGRCNRRAKV